MDDGEDGQIQLPCAFEEADHDHLVLLIVDMLNRLIAHNDKIPLSPEALTRFHSRSPPAISVLDYLRRIVKYTKTDRSCLLIVLHYIDQICARMPAFTISSLTIHRFLITALAVASKALCDAFCTNVHYAKVGGIRIAEFNLLEREFLAQIEWKLTCTGELLQTYYVNLVRTHTTHGFALLDPPETQMPTDSPENSDVEVTMEDIKDGTTSDSDTDVRSKSRRGTDRRSITELPSESAPLPSTLGPVSSTGLIPTSSLDAPIATGPQAPTLEQNMAFASLLSESSASSASGSTSGQAEAYPITFRMAEVATPVNSKFPKRELPPPGSSEASFEHRPSVKRKLEEKVAEDKDSAM